MADGHTKEIRSKNMAVIKGKNTKPEMLVRHFLHTNGYRFIAKQSMAGGNPNERKSNYTNYIYTRRFFSIT
jgi:DNA mismatch endonuclease (patch repair protein)